MNEITNSIKRIQYQYLALTAEKKSQIRDKLLKKVREVIDILNSAESAEEDEKESFTPTINDPIPPFCEEEKTEKREDREDKIFPADNDVKNLYELWKNSSYDDKFRFVPADDKEEYIYFDRFSLEECTDELKSIDIEMYAYTAGDEYIQVWLDRKNFMKIKRRKSIYCNPICGTLIRVFTICDDDYVTFRDPSTNDSNDCFMVKWGNVPQKIKTEIGLCTNNLLSCNYDLEDNEFFWSFSLGKCEYNRVVNLLCNNAGEY